ncbi:MAG TPA: CHAT domain-containing protein [Actinoplanes sp.]
MDLDHRATEFEALNDLDGYLRRNAAPDERIASEARIVERLGGWLGERLLGARIGHLLVNGAEDTVRVQLGDGLDVLPHWPVELAHVDGVPLARHGISLVYQWSDPSAGAKQPVGERLRILALFSMPSETSVLALRRERYALSQLVRRMVATHAVELRVLQYGVTRDRLRAVAEEEPGWDVLHLAGHGSAGGLLLEQHDGTPDTLSTTDLVAILRPARRRLKLAVLGMCYSAAATAAETMRWLQLDEQADALDAGRDPGADSADPVGLARGLVDRLGVAAVAMRYPVCDDFAIALTAELYPRLLDGMPVDRAVALAVPAAAGQQPSAGCPPLSLVTPAVFGPATGLALRPPAGAVNLDLFQPRMPASLKEPERFVGRTRLLIDAARALAPGSGKTGVLLVGMAGAGKTTAAQELAYQHGRFDALSYQHGRFGALAWWQAPSRDANPGEAIVGLAHALETQLGHLGFTMLDALGSDDRLRGFLTRLSGLLRDQPVLLVLDNLESLLARSGSWRDPIWSALIETLTGHGGQSRVVLTSRVVPAGLDTETVAVLPTHALSLAESILLARELKNLRLLLHDDPGPDRAARVTADRALARTVIRLVQGHPKLLELADAAAADPDRLRAWLAAAEQAVGDAPLAAFFATGASDLDDDDFLSVLSQWTVGALNDLPEPARRLAAVLACLEDADRQSTIVEAAWPELGEGPLGDAVAALQAAAIVDPVPATPTDPDSIVIYTVHPGVAEAIRGNADSGLRLAVDELLGKIWRQTCREQMEFEDQGSPTATAMAVHAALAAVPYLLRRSRFDEAVVLLGHAYNRDRAPAQVARISGYLQQVRARATDPVLRMTGDLLYGAVLSSADPDQAEVLLRAVLDQARAEGIEGLSDAAASALTELLQARGRLTEALQIAEETGDEPARLRILVLAGKYPEVLDRATTLLDDATARDAGRWTTREQLLDLAVFAARGVEKWSLALDFNRRIGHSEQQRGASAHERARTRLNEANLLRRLNRYAEADRLLLDCQQTFEDLDDIRQLSEVFSSRAQLEFLRHRQILAVELEERALRYAYTAPEINRIAICHQHLGEYLQRSRPRSAAANLLAAALLWQVTGHDAFHATMTALSMIDPCRGGNALPKNLDALTAQLESIPGVRFGAVFANLVPDPDERVARFDAITTHTERFVYIRGGGEFLVPTPRAPRRPKVNRNRRKR